MKNKEYGSDLIWPTNPAFKKEYVGTNCLDFGELFFSGRSALFSIIEEGIEQLGWNNIFVPSYYCQEVYDFISDLDIDISFYESNPLTNNGMENIADKPGNVMLSLDYFGINRTKIPKFNFAHTIEDVTLNLDARHNSEANIIFGSLRKVLPIPVGGFVLSNLSGFKIKAADTSITAETLALQKMSGMFLKQKYLNEGFGNKELFRTLLKEAEQNFCLRNTNCKMPQFVKALLSTLDIDAFIEVKKKNFQIIKTSINQSKKFKILSTGRGTEYALILLFKETEDCYKMRSHLIENKIYPMLLWPGQKRLVDVDIENKLLFVHIDFRHTGKDMVFIANKINELNL